MLIEKVFIVYIEEVIHIKELHSKCKSLYDNIIYNLLINIIHTILNNIVVITYMIIK